MLLHSLPVKSRKRLAQDLITLLSYILASLAYHGTDRLPGKKKKKKKERKKQHSNGPISTTFKH